MVPESRSTQPPHGDPDAQRGGPGRLGQQGVQPLGGPRQHQGRVGAVVPDPPLGHHSPAQIEQGDRRIGHRHMDSAHNES